MNKPPKQLSREAKKIWREVNSTFVLESGDLTLLQVALEAFDRLREAQAVVTEEGLIITDPSGRKRANPALQVEKEARLAFLRAWRQLGLDQEPPGQIGRPPGR